MYSVGFPSRIQCIKNFEGGGGSKGSWGWGLRSNFGAPFLYVYVLFWGLILSNSVLTLYGLILAPTLNLFKLRFWFWELNCSFRPKICS